MSSNPRGMLRAALGTLAPALPADSDAELLGRYVAARDQDAFAALVRRHGPMVHGVCRRRLRSGPDADDAFQVTFMVLARDAAKVARRESLPGWLYRVAYLVALKLAGKNARREADPLMDHDAADRANPRGRGRRAGVEGRPRSGASRAAGPAAGGSRPVRAGGADQRGGREAARLPRGDRGLAALGRTQGAEGPAQSPRAGADRRGDTGGATPPRTRNRAR